MCASPWKGWRSWPSTTGGQLVRILRAAPHERVDLSDLPTGSYLARMTSTQAVRVARLVVMR